VGKSSLGRLRHRWENIKRDLQEVDGGMDWIDLAQNRECGNELPGSIKCKEFLDWLRMY